MITEPENVIQIKRHKCKRSPWHTGPFQIDEDCGTVECLACETHLTPMAVLKWYARKESELNVRISNLVDKLKKIEAKKSCKCEHCGKMTIIDRSLY